MFSIVALTNELTKKYKYVVIFFAQLPSTIYPMKMNNSKIKLLSVVFALLFSVNAIGQDKKSTATNAEIPHIRLKAGIQKSKVTLRWAIDEPIAWQKANKIGFRLKRYTLMRDGKLLSTSEEKDLGVFLPKPMEAWKEIVEKNDHAAIVAQSLFGESFEVEMGDKPGQLQGIVNKSQEIEQRFAFALMAADLDFEIALMAGWGYTDNEVKANERYVYIVELNATNNTKNLKVQKADATVSMDKVDELPVPLGFVGIYQDQTVTLAWEYQQLKDMYTSYYIEKAEDGVNFKSLGDLPVVNMNDKPEKQSPGMMYIDSLTKNSHSYSYRIRGKTVFGDYGPYSNVVSGAGKKTLEASPRIVSSDIGTDNDIQLNWEFPKESENEINGFQLIYSESDLENSYQVVKDKISVNERSVSIKSQGPSNYFKIRALAKSSTNRESFSVLIQPNDDTPPVVPTEVTGKIDSTGLVHLLWKANTEKDLGGYHVFRGTQKGQELLRLTAQAVSIAKYTDTVKLESLDNVVYYYVTAVDQRKNQSAPSEIIALEKPDKVIPQAPVFTAYKLEDGIIKLSWLKSYSDDVKVHQLYRQALDDTDKNWKMIFETQELTPEFNYLDKEVTTNHRYRYYLLAIDKSMLKSDKSQEITLTAIDLQAKSVLSNLSVIAGKDKKMIQLSWKIDSKEVNEILVYRQKNAEKSQLWGTLDGKQNFIEDKDVQIGNSYTYILKAMLNTNQPAKTEKIMVQH